MKEEIINVFKLENGGKDGSDRNVHDGFSRGSDHYKSNYSLSLIIERNNSEYS